MRIFKIAVLAITLAAALSSPADAHRCSNGKSPDGAMWFSILHPGLGEYFLKGWGPWSKMPPKKFYLGFIPIFGWPGYLQVVSAIDAANCRTHDWNE